MKKNEYISPDYVKYALANTPQVTFEVTDACNLRFRYCGYGELYGDYDARENRRLSDQKALLLPVQPDLQSGCVEKGICNPQLKDRANGEGLQIPLFKAAGLQIRPNGL